MAQDDKPNGGKTPNGSGEPNRTGKPSTPGKPSSSGKPKPGSKPAGKPSGSKPTSPANKKPATGKGPQPPRTPTGRQSVAAARQSSSGNNRTQFIIGGIAIAVILIIVIGGVIFTQRQSQVQAEGYGPSTQSVATANKDGVVLVSKPGSTPKVTIDIYEDALCPVCAQFEKQFGQQIGRSLDEGTLAVNYHMLNFLNPRSFSGDYSTRAAAALLCVAQEDGDKPGAYMGMHSALMSVDNQPEEQGSEDFTNEQLAQMASTEGATTSSECISSGKNVDVAAASAVSSTATLSAVTNGRVATPTVVNNGAPVAELNVDWLTNLLAS